MNLLPLVGTLPWLALGGLPSDPGQASVSKATKVGTLSSFLIMCYFVATGQGMSKTQPVVQERT